MDVFSILNDKLLSLYLLRPFCDVQCSLHALILDKTTLLMFMGMVIKRKGPLSRLLEITLYSLVVKNGRRNVM